MIFFDRPCRCELIRQSCPDDCNLARKLRRLTFFILCNRFADIFALASSIRIFSAALSLLSFSAVLFLQYPFSPFPPEVDLRAHRSISACFSSFISFSTPLTASHRFSSSFRFSNVDLIEGEM